MAILGAMVEGVCVVLVFVLGEGRSVSGVILLDRGMERRGEREARQERGADYMDLYISLFRYIIAMSTFLPPIAQLHAHRQLFPSGSTSAGPNMAI